MRGIDRHATIKTRTREALSKLGAPFAAVWRTVRTQKTIEREEVLFLVSLALVGWSLWDVYRPAAIGVPALFLLWVSLPPRPPFFDREPRDEKKRRG